MIERRADAVAMMTNDRRGFPFRRLSSKDYDVRPTEYLERGLPMVYLMHSCPRLRGDGASA